MPDITMCINNKCCQKQSCYRYRATPSTYQSFADFSAVCNSTVGFSEYIEYERRERNEGTKEKRSTGRL